MRTTFWVLLGLAALFLGPLQGWTQFPQQDGGGGPGGGRGGRGGGADLTEHRYNVTVSLMFNNVLNHTNPGGFVGLINSPKFGDPTNVFTGFGGGGPGGGGPGGGGGTTANNRRIDMSVRFNF
jgi:hypothetical protein